MPILAVIPARLGATRLPRKPLRLLGGAPLVVRVWERITALRIADRVVVATDAPEVCDVARAAGAEAVLTRDDHPSGTDRAAEVAGRAEYAAYDTIVNLQGDEPFVSGDAVRGAIGLVADRAFALATAARAADPQVLGEPSVVKVVRADDGRALYFSRAAIPYLRDDADRALRDRRVLQHIGVYVYDRSALMRWVALPEHPLERVERLEQLRPLAAGMTMGVAIVDDAPTLGIDTEDDLARANAHWTNTFAERV